MFAIIKRSIILLLVIAVPFALQTNAQRRKSRAPAKPDGRAAGLAVNLDLADQERPRTISTRVAPGSPVPVEATPVSTSRAPMPTPRPVIVDMDTSRSPAKRDKKDAGDPYLAARNALAEAIKAPGIFRRWTSPVHGLSLSLSQVREVDSKSRVVVIAIRNTESSAIRLVPGPDVYVQTFDKKGNPLQIEQLKKLNVQTSVVDGAIPAGATCYYALVYETPILGASQRMRVSIAQINAADEPAAAEITSSKR